MYNIDMVEMTPEFLRMWLAAARHLERISQGTIGWLKATPTPPILEHLSFRLGNQLFFVHLFDVAGRVYGPGSLAGLSEIADSCLGSACLMPMECVKREWKVRHPGWGLRDRHSLRPVDPPALVSDELIEMTDWEIYDCAVGQVRQQIEAAGVEIMSSSGDPRLNPSLWFVGSTGPEWVVVRAVRAPDPHASRPGNWQAIADSVAHLSTRGHFTSVRLNPLAVEGRGGDRLWRGFPMHIEFEPEGVLSCET